MTRTVGTTYAIAGAITAAALLVATAATAGLGGPSSATTAVDTAGAGAAGPATAIEAPVLPAGALQEGERIVSAELIQTPGGPVQHVTVEPAPAARGSHDDDDDDDEHEEHEEHGEDERAEWRERLDRYQQSELSEQFRTRFFREDR